MQKTIAAVAGAGAGAGAPQVDQVVLTGDPASELIKASSEASLLVVGSHGARPLTELLLGSVATQCARHAHCPVLVMSPSAAEGR